MSPAHNITDVQRAHFGSSPTAELRAALDAADRMVEDQAGRSLSRITMFRRQWDALERGLSGASGLSLTNCTYRGRWLFRGLK